jgi:putative oxidoreductase
MNRHFPYLLGAVRVLAGVLFWQHGAEKLWGFAGSRIDHNFAALRAWGGPIEIAGGTLIALGLYTRITAFILCGEMAVAYFKSWAPRGFFPIQNGGEEAVQYCYFYLWLVTAGGGVWSLDQSLRTAITAVTQRLASWEGQARSVLRVIFGFLFLLHGVRLAFNALPALAGRRMASPMPLDQLPQFIGYGEMIVGALLMLGAWTRPVALISAFTTLAAYFLSISRNLVWPIRGGGNETLLYTAIFACLAALGAGDWSLDSIIQSWRGGAVVTSSGMKQHVG